VAGFDVADCNIKQRPRRRGMKTASMITAAVEIGSLIVTVRGHRVILDSDLARIYAVPTKRLNEQVKRNAKRFPPEFMFQLTEEEVTILRSRFANAPEAERLRSQIATAKAGRGGRRTLPYAFTKHGALMAANVPNSERAVEISVYVIRAFMRMRAEFARHRDLARRLAEIERTLIGHDRALRDLYTKIGALLLPSPDARRRRIGFLVKEAAARYRAVHGKKQRAGA
jgi:hypothetical protein